MRGVLTASIGLLIGFVAAIGSAHADHPGAVRAADSAPSGAFVDASSLNKRVRDLHARLQKADSSSRAQILGDLVAAAQARARRLAVLMEESPADFLQAAMSARERGQFPPEVRAHLEEEADEDGEIEVLHEDRWGSDRYLYALQTAGDRLAVHFANVVPNLLTGDLVRVRGVRLGRAVAANGGGSGVTLLSAALSNTFGEQQTLVIAINFSNAPTAYTSTNVSQMQSVTFTAGSSASNYYRETSYGETWLAGTVVGPFTIPYSSSSSGCDYYSIASLARSAATAAGVNISLYRRYVYAFPSAVNCNWWGLGTIGGNPSQAWINGSYQNGVVVHEMGHNLGLFHSHALECGSVAIGGSCTNIEYGDTLDAMGGASPPYHFNAIQKELLGWLNNGSMPPITTVQASGVYTIDPYETDGTNPKALKVRAPNGDWYYVEYRQPIGFDAAIHTSVRTGVVVHVWKYQSGDGIYLLDMTPSTTSWIDPALQIGATFTDSAAGISISPLWVNGTNAGVSVSVGGGGTTCVRANPAVAVSPAVKLGPAGSQLSYTVSITNKDVGCSAATFSGQATKPTGWSAAFTASSVTLAPGATTSTTLQVTSPTVASPGDYAINITAQAVAAPSYMGSTTATYGVEASGGGAAGGFADSFTRSDASSLGPDWKDVSGDLVVQGGQARNAATMGLHMAVVADLAGASQSARARFTSLDNNNGPRFGVLLRYRDSRNFYACYRQTGGSSALRIVRVTNGIESILARSAVPNPKKGQPFELGCAAQGNTLTLTLDGQARAAASDATFGSGGLGLVMGYIKLSGQGRSHRADDFTAQAN